MEEVDGDGIVWRVSAMAHSADCGRQGGGGGDGGYFVLQPNHPAEEEEGSGEWASY